jgi:hypothetical protein
MPLRLPLLLAILVAASRGDPSGGDYNTSICKIQPYTCDEVNMKDRKRRPEGGEWEPPISFEIFGRCPKITAKYKRVLKLNYSSQLVTEALR